MFKLKPGGWRKSSRRCKFTLILKWICTARKQSSSASSTSPAAPSPQSKLQMKKKKKKTIEAIETARRCRKLGFLAQTSSADQTKSVNLRKSSSKHPVLGENVGGVARTFSESANFGPDGCALSQATDNGSGSGTPIIRERRNVRILT